jgi:hypothetical protein
MSRRRSAQSTLEFAGLTVIVIAVLIAMGNYFKRGVQGRWKVAVDDLGDQYDPLYVNSDITDGTIVNSVTTLTAVPAAGGGYWTSREDRSKSIQIKYGSSTVGTPP